MWQIVTYDVLACMHREGDLSFVTGGPDSLRPQHLKDMISDSAGSAGPMLLRVLTAFINLILPSRAPLPVHPFLFGPSLVALNRKDVEVKPIAVGYLEGKCASAQVKQSMSTLLAPLQVELIWCSSWR